VRGAAGITHGQLERMQNNWTGRGSSENSLKMTPGHKVSRNQQPDGEREGARVVWPREVKPGKADESNLQNVGAKKRE